MFLTWASEAYSRIDVWPTRNLQTSKKWKCLLKRHVCIYIYICMYVYLHIYMCIPTNCGFWSSSDRCMWLKKNHRTMSPTSGLGPLGLSKTRPWPQRPRKIHPRRWDGPKRRNHGSMISDVFFNEGNGGCLGGCLGIGVFGCYQRHNYGVFFLKWEF